MGKHNVDTLQNNTEFITSTEDQQHMQFHSNGKKMIDIKQGNHKLVNKMVMDL